MPQWSLLPNIRYGCLHWAVFIVLSLRLTAHGSLNAKVGKCSGGVIWPTKNRLNASPRLVVEYLKTRKQDGVTLDGQPEIKSRK